MSDTDCTILRCPDCRSHRAGIVASAQPQARCADCGKVYDIATFPLPNIPKPKRLAEPGKRHRRDKGPQALEVTEKPLPQPSELGQLHLHTDQMLRGGPDELLASNKRAQILAEEHGEAFGEEFKLQWTFKTKWLQDLEATHRGRERVKYAMQWRPTFLAVVALSHSIMLGCKAATISPGTVIAQRNADPDFDAQVLAAQAHCIELLHSVTMRRALEGDLEPVYWQGIRVGSVKKFDGRLQIEMLRAYMPDRFKTPGSRVNINTGNQLLAGNNFIIDTPVMLKLQEMRQESLRKLAEKKAQAREIASNDAKQAGTGPPAGVPPAT